jgi:hypothetical protein
MISSCPRETQLAGLAEGCALAIDMAFVRCVLFWVESRYKDEQAGDHLRQDAVSIIGSTDVRTAGASF